MEATVSSLDGRNFCEEIEQQGKMYWNTLLIAEPKVHLGELI